MKITWLGQAGLLFETGDKKIVVDPYLSNSVEAIDPNKKRKVSVNEAFLKIKPNIILLTHNHLDHTDPKTLAHYLTEDSDICVLASGTAWLTVRKFGGNNNYVQFNRHTQWTENHIRFTAVKAEHSDVDAIGIIMEAEGKKYYITGDTLYNDDIFTDLPEDIDYIFLPVNGSGNNMNLCDAARFCEKVGAKAVPLHCGLFDSIDMHSFKYENKFVPEFYKEVIL